MQNRLDSTALQIAHRRIKDLRPDPRNPRAHSKSQIRQIGKSIKAFGFLVPVLVDSQGMIVAGHGRLLAAEQLGMTEVPSILIDHLSPEQLRAYQIADNRLQNLSEWEPQLLALNLKELAAADLDFSLDVVGFEMAEIDLKIANLDSPKENADQDDTFVTAAGPAVSQLGDLWMLDEHRLFCGNSLEEASYATLLAGAKAGMVFTDPPYSVRINGHVSGKGAIKHREFVMGSGEMSEDEFTEFLTTSCRLMAQFSTAGSIQMLCMDWRHLTEILAAGRATYTELKNICVWNKGTGGMGSLYRSQHEFVLVFKSGNAPHVNNIQLGRFGRNRTNMWNYSGMNSWARATDEGNLLALHPTVKPVAMVADAILDCSKRRDIVLDPYLGSGSTLMAAERTGRRCYGIELDPLYVDTGILRWQKYTGQRAIHQASGMAFDELAAQEVRHDDAA